MSELRETVTSPIAWALGAFGAIVGGLGLGPIVDLLAATSGLWSTLLIVGGRLVGGVLGSQLALAGFIGLFVVVMGKFGQKLVTWSRK